jgi:hypothetical protein
MASFHTVNCAVSARKILFPKNYFKHFCCYNIKHAFNNSIPGICFATSENNYCKTAISNLFAEQ